MGDDTIERMHLSTQSLAQHLREKRSEMMLSELEAVALKLFDDRGFNDVTVQDIADEAQISVRTFYRYCPTKEDVLQLRIDRRAAILRAALSTRPLDEPPLRSLRVALVETVSAEDMVLLRRWITVIVATPSVLRGVVGGIHLKARSVVADFFADKLGLPREALIPTMVAAATGGVIEATQTHWFFYGGDLATMISDSLEVLERGLGTDPQLWMGESN